MKSSDSLDDIPADLAGRLWQAMRKRGLTQTELAEQAKVRNNTLGDILSGKTAAPGVDTIAKLCLALRANPNYVILGLLPRFFEESSTELQPVAVPENQRLGVDQWISEMRLSTEERAYMRALRWDDPRARQSDMVYLLALAAYRQSRVGQAEPDNEQENRIKR